jgi:predicted membrane chloride channel (bestrophin family)
LLSFTAGPERGYTQDERTAAYELVEACFVLHGWILCDYLRQSASTTTTNNGNTNRSQKKQTKILQKSLALPIELTQQLWNDDNTSSADSVSSTSSSTSSPIPSSLRFLLRNQQRYQYQSPSALINIITLGMMTRIPSLDPQEATLIEEQFTEIISSVGTCEKILRTPIPLGTLRYVTLLAWCICINHSYKSTVRHNIDTTISILYDRIIMHLHVMSLASSCSLSRLLH